jgi:hypothetical protein
MSASKSGCSLLSCRDMDVIGCGIGAVTGFDADSFAVMRLDGGPHTLRACAMRPWAALHKLVSGAHYALGRGRPGTKLTQVSIRVLVLELSDLTSVTKWWYSTDSLVHDEDVAESTLRP